MSRPPKVTIALLACGATLIACVQREGNRRTDLKNQGLDPGARQGATSDSPFGGGGPVGPCRAVPKAGAPLPALPAELPLPRNVRLADEPPPAAFTRGQRTKAALLAVPLSLKDTVKFWTDSWPKKGWILGAGESEFGEVENSFRRDRFGGAVRARSAYCDRSWTELLIVMGEGGPACPPGIPGPCFYKFSGFLPPISNTHVNIAKAGQPVILRWTLADPEGRPITDLARMIENHFSQPNRGSSSSLRLEEDRYRLTVFTVSSWAATSKVFTLTLDDGSSHSARFRFR